ncbi:biliverdin-producing heme oxygenase [Streptomyces sp. 3MP-14]|uniref:Biliverdin-producing heme oxygenase n=1 Tax=Streptomyces mimosae TaxID=2586635 RepID=A0A5N6AKX0_9ACTN|nr:biliverdin-producing heme oxygenase [Streptomyces mimosae]KAB8178178.1 biliverdin-producing heme oxygenase [Streptomyces sp. 3MP-14]
MAGRDVLPRPVALRPWRSRVTVLDATPAPFSTLIRQASHAQHEAAHDSTFMDDLLGGRLGIDAFRRYTEQLWFVYRALEEGAERLAADPVAGPFLRPELFRVPALERDLDHLHGGADWRATVHALPTTERYAARVREVAETWPGGYVAHHYTRYLGDLSGGQVVRSVAEKTWGLERRGDGVRFYVFDEVPNPAAFKREYRTALDAIAVDEAERERVVGECRLAFGLNIALLSELDAVAR